MEILFETIESLLNSLLPAGSELLTEFSSFNELIAYLLTLSMLYAVLIRPILRLIGVVKK